MDQDNQEVVYIENWNDLCRLCLRNDQPLQNLFYEDTLLENVQEATNLNFSEDDSLPNSICKLCIEQVHSFAEFRSRCKATDEWLRNEAVTVNDNKDSITIVPDVMDTKDLLLVEPNQFEEQLIDDPQPVIDQQVVENEIELSHCIVQTEEVMQMTVNKKERLETSNSDYQCTICGKELLSAYTLANHMRSHTGERPYGCSVCEKFFKTKSNLNEHYRVHNPELRWMKTSSRDIPSITRVTVTSEDMLTCGQCSEVFVSLEELSAHELIHANQQRQRKQQQQQRIASAATFTCEKCNKIFTSKSQLTSHIGNKCLDSDGDRHCPFCDKPFRSLATLENHKRVHTREKPFMCDVCAKPFRTKGNLLEHKRVHSNTLWLLKSDQKIAMDTDGGVGVGTGGGGDQRFQCTFCSKPFRTYTALLNHERVHTREKPFECSVCGKCFRTKSNLAEHMKGCHDMDLSAYGSDEVQVFTFKTQSAVTVCKLESS